MRLFTRLREALPFARRRVWAFTHDNREALSHFTPAALPRPVNFRWVDAAEAPLLQAASLELGRAPGLYARRFAAGRRCFAAFDGAEPLGWRWTAVGALDPDLDLSPPLLLRPGEAYDFDVFVAREWRGGGLYRMICRESFAAQLALGLERGFGTVIDANLVSLASVSRFSILVAALDRRRAPLRWRFVAERPATQEDASAMAARFAKPATVRADPGWLARRGHLLSL